MEVLKIELLMLDMRVMQQGNKLDIVMWALDEIYGFKLPGSYVLWGNHTLGFVHRVIIPAINQDFIFALQKLRYHESNQIIFRLIQ